MNKCPLFFTNATIRPNKPHWLKCPISPTALGLQGAEEDARHTCTLQVPELWRGDTGPRCRRSQRCEAAEGLWRAVASCGELALLHARNLPTARGSPNTFVDARVGYSRWFRSNAGLFAELDAFSALMVQSSDLEPGPVGKVSHLSFFRVVLVTCG